MLAASGSQDKKICLWSVLHGGLIAKLDGHTGMVNCLSFHPHTEWLVSGGVDRDLRLWRESDGAFLREVKGHKGAVGPAAACACPRDPLRCARAAGMPAGCHNAPEPGRLQANALQASGEAAGEESGARDAGAGGR